MEQFYLTDIQSWAVGVALAITLMDIITGLIKAFITKTFESSKMREGLGHKMLLICFIAIAYIIEIGGAHIPGLGFTEATVPAVCIYIIVMELGSCAENIVQGYPELKDTPIIKLFIKKED